MKLKTLCKLALTALEKAKAKQSELYMSALIDNLDARHPCNTAACVCGFMAIEDTEHPYRYTRDLAEEYYGSFYDTALGRSIVRSSMKSRRLFALGSDFFTCEELSTIPHLNKHNPSIDDAIEYIKIVLEKIGDDDL